MSTDIDVTSNINLVTTAETPLAVFNFATPMANNPVPQVAVPTRISGVIQVTTGTGATSVSIRVRQGVGTAGSTVGPTYQQLVSASSPYVIPFRNLDPVGALSYTVTVQQNGASGNGLTLGSCNADQNLSGMD